MTTKRQMSETYVVAAILASAGGFLDAYSYLVRGHVFANAQTGNIVLLGMRFFDLKTEKETNSTADNSDYDGCHNNSTSHTFYSSLNHSRESEEGY